MDLRLRPLQPTDQDPLRSIMIESLEDLECDHTEYLSDGSEPANLFDQFDGPGSAYLVVIDEEDVVLGGGGFAPLSGAPPGVAEVQKMYLARSARGKGVGRALLQAIVVTATTAGYDRLYLETTPQMEDAQRLYWAAGFLPREERLGNTGHHDCTVFMERSLDIP